MLGGWLLATWIAFAGGGDLVLPPGGTIQALGPGPIVRYVADRDGPVTIALDSFEMDAFLCVTDASGTLIAAAEDGGIRQNARVVVELRAGQTVWIECTTMNPNRWSGRFTLSARPGDVPPPTGPQRDAIEGEFYRAYAGRYLSKGDPVRAAESLAFGARLFLRANSLDRAVAAAKDAWDLARAIDRVDIELNALTTGSLAAEHLADHASAIELARESLALATVTRSDARPIAEITFRLGRALLVGGRLVEARLAFEFGRDTSASADLQREWSRHELGLAQVAHRDEDLELASRHLDAAETHAQSMADVELLRSIDLERTLLAFRRVRFAEANQRLEEQLARAYERRDFSAIGMCRSTLGLVQMNRRRDYDAAERELRAAIGAFEDAGEPVNHLGARMQLLEVRQRRILDTTTGDSISRDAANRHSDALRELLTEAREVGAAWVEASIVLQLAEWSEWTKSDGEALRLAEEAEQIFAVRVGSPDGALRARRLQAFLRLRRGETAFARTVLDDALAHRAARETARDADDAVGDRVNAEAWSRLAIDVAAACVRDGADAAREFVRCASWRDRALFSGIPLALLMEQAEQFVGYRWPSTTRYVEFASGRDHSYAFVAGGGAMKLVELGPRSQLESLADTFVARVRDPRSEPLQFVGAGRALFDALLANVVAEGGVERVLVSPGEAFAVLPFDALLARDARPDAPCSDLAFAVRSLQIDLVPSWRTCVTGLPDRNGTADLGTLVVGDPSPTRMPPLPGAEHEARWIADHFRDAHGPDVGIELLVREDATRDRVLAGLARADLVHFAAHAEVDWSDPSLTGIVLAHDERLTLADIRSTTLRADLTVLSACATAAGQARSGSGLLSVASAFLDAGSRGVIATRFPVDDASADLFQRRFYLALWHAGLEPAAALRTAKLEFLDGSAVVGDSRPPRGRPAVTIEDTRPVPTAHPSRWAAFVYSSKQP